MLLFWPVRERVYHLVYHIKNMMVVFMTPLLCLFDHFLASVQKITVHPIVRNAWFAKLSPSNPVRLWRSSNALIWEYFTPSGPIAESVAVAMVALTLSTVILSCGVVRSSSKWNSSLWIMVFFYLHYPDLYVQEIFPTVHRPFLLEFQPRYHLPGESPESH